jgi:N-acetyl-alpha-D-glucosaminyl L-malate synthase BshA
MRRGNLKKLHIGITCYPTIGGSGIVATELGMELARRGHQVHFISYDRPFRADLSRRNVYFHKVPINSYELFKYPDYTQPLAVMMNEVHHRYHLDILHVHYAVPHATAALLARDICDFRCRSHPKIVTTLHGTDITLIGRDPNLKPIVKYSIENSDGVTAVSRALKQETNQIFKLRHPIEVIHNFYTPAPPTRTALSVRRALGITAGDPLVIHLSNLRPVKRLPDILQAMAYVARQEKNAKLLVIAGADFSPYRRLVAKLKLARHVIVKNSVHDIGNYINAADLGLYASDTESFGMGLLETMSYGRPIVATRVGGIPEVVARGKTGLLRRVGDTRGLAADVLRLIRQPELRLQMGRASAKRAQTHFSADNIVQKYLNYYYKLLKK